MRLELVADVTSIGNKVVIFSDREGSVFLHDVENDVWSEKSCEATKHIKYFSCAILPQWNKFESNGIEEINIDIV